jgi:hypothetical protein
MLNSRLPRYLELGGCRSKELKTPTSQGLAKPEPVVSDAETKLLEELQP